jgi:hypothetical protein
MYIHMTQFHCGWVVWTTALWGTIIVTVSSYREFREHIVCFFVETNYLHWNTTFPPLYEQDDSDYIQELFQ